MYWQLIFEVSSASSKFQMIRNLETESQDNALEQGLETAAELSLGVVAFELIEIRDLQGNLVWFKPQ